VFRKGEHVSGEERERSEPKSDERERERESGTEKQIGLSTEQLFCRSRFAHMHRQYIRLFATKAD